MTAAEVVVPCPELGPTLAFFTDRLGFVLELITPADAPEVAVVSGHGVRLRLDATAPGDGAALRLRLAGEGPDTPAAGPPLVAPNGTVVEVVSPPTDHGVLPPAQPRFEISRHRGSENGFGTGRASMAYRDLLPQRQGGRYIASLIRIAAGGPVPDYVHHHRIRFQLIYCRRGWVRVVYQDQGPPFVMEAGDCVLQPPGIRHRVLESSDGLEVVEVGCPARHDTVPDPTLDLPNDVVDRDRTFGGQRFVRHVADEATWTTAPDGGRRHRDLGITAATSGLAEVRVHRSTGTGPSILAARDDAELHFFFVDHGRVRLDGAVPSDQLETGPTLGPGDAVALPPGLGLRLVDWTDDAEVLEIMVPASAGGG